VSLKVVGSSGRKRWVAVGVTALLAGTVGNWAAAGPVGAAVPATGVATAGVAAGQRVTESPDRASASLAAQAQGTRVEVSGERTETSTLWANPDGTLTVDESTGPVRVRHGEDWVPVDLDLAKVAGGWAPKASPSPVTFSPGGDGPAVRLAEGSKKVALDWAKTLPAPTIDGPKATYALDATTDLVLTALPDGR
jgi:hypothetical protein